LYNDNRLKEFPVLQSSSTASKKPKVFVLDTNVILHDCSCIYKFEENNVAIPIRVIEELDNFKKGTDSLSFHAREFVRNIDALSSENLFNGGVTIGPNLGKMMIKLEREFHHDLALNFSADKNDHHILNTAYYLHKEQPQKQVILVTKDVNLRMKARAVGLLAEDYTSDYIKNIDSLYSGKRIEENVDEALINGMYIHPCEVAPESFGFATALAPNEYVILRNHKKSALAVYDAQNQQVKRVDKLNAYGITPRNAEQAFALHAVMDPSIRLVTIAGKAGTGKTLLALAGAIEQRKNFRQIYMARPIVPLSNKDMGFLPGDVNDKLEPYMQPLYDNLGVIQNQFSSSDHKNKKIKELLDEKKLVISPLSYIRGRSLVNIYFIVDEAQNLTPHEVKTIITRAGENTKMVFTGDIFQIDHPYLNTFSNGLSYLIEKMRGQSISAHITLEKGERSSLADLASDLL
jgi:PhoH-like ATPase